MAPQTAISKAVCYKTKNEQLWEKAVHFLLVATNCFYAGLPTVFCTITIYQRTYCGFGFDNSVLSCPNKCRLDIQDSVSFSWFQGFHRA